jgi:hypothetical protein
LDLVLVEASPEQIASVLKQLKARPEEFPSVTEFPTAAGQSLLETQKGEGQGQERRKELGEAAADRSGGDKRNSARDADQGGGQASASIAQEKLSATEEGVADAARADHGKREQAAEPAPYAARIPPPRQRVAGAGESLGRSLNAPAGGQSGADFGMGGGAGSASGGPAALSKAGSGPAPATEARPAPDAPKPEAKAESPPRVAPANQPKQPDQPKGKLAPHRTDTFKKEREKDAFRDGVEGTQPGRPSSPHRVLFVLRLAGSDVPASASKESRAAKAEVTKAAEPASPAQAAPVKE